MKSFLASAILCLAALSTSAQPTTPNVLLVMYDDLDYFGDLEPYDGHTDVTTPFAATLATEGLKFNAFYANAPICSPTRVSQLTGFYPSTLGFSLVTGPDSRRGIPDEFLTLPRMFNAYGYATGAFGKWHAGKNLSEVYPAGVGFDTSVVDCSYLNIGVEPQYGTSYYNTLFCEQPGQPLTPPADPEDAHATTYSVTRTVEFIEDSINAGDPFFAQLWLHAPHTPLNCPNGYACNCNLADPGCPRQVYAAMISHTESELMRLKAVLDKHNAWDDTIVILTSDNGGVGSTQHSMGTSLRGAKHSTYERGVRVPFLMAGPGISQGQIHEMVLGHDLFPTFAEVLGYPTDFPNDYPSDLPGQSIADLVWGAGMPLADRTLFWETNPTSHPRQHALTDSWNRYGVRKEILGTSWKLVQSDLWAGGVIPELYDFSINDYEAVDASRTNFRERSHLENERSNLRVSTSEFDYQVADLGTATYDSATDTYTFNQSTVVELEDSPILTTNNLDLSFSLTMNHNVPAGDYARILERQNSWSLILRTDQKLTLQVQENGSSSWVQVTNQTPINPNQDYDVVAVIEQGRGISLYVNGIEARLRKKVNPLAETNTPVLMGRHVSGADHYLGTISNLKIHPIALHSRDLELDNVYAMGFEPAEVDPVTGDYPFTGAWQGQLEVVSTEAHRGSQSLKYTADVANSYTLPWRKSALAVRTNDADSKEFQVSAWVKTDGTAFSKIRLSLYCLDANEDFLWHDRSFSLTSEYATPEWRRVTHRHVCPVGTEFLSFRLDNQDSGAVTFWDDIAIAKVSNALLNLDFENETVGTAVQSVFAGTYAATDTDAYTGDVAMLVPANSTSPINIRNFGATNHFTFSLWARNSGAMQSIRMELYCLDSNDQPIPLPGKQGNCIASNTACEPGLCPVGGCPAACDECVRSHPGRLTSEWQQYKLSNTCPVGTTKTGIKLETTGGNDVLIDDLLFSATSIP